MKINFNVETFETHCELECQGTVGPRRTKFTSRYATSGKLQMIHILCRLHLMCTGIPNQAQPAFARKKSMAITKKSLLQVQYTSTMLIVRDRVHCNVHLALPRVRKINATKSHVINTFRSASKKRDDTTIEFSSFQHLSFVLHYSINMNRHLIKIFSDAKLLHS